MPIIINRIKSDLFVDTSGWADLVLRNAPDFAVTEAYYKQIVAEGRGLVTTNYIVTELVALLTARTSVSRARVIAYVNGIRRTPRVQIIHVDAETDAEAWRLLERYTDKSWSLVDAASFTVMRRLGIDEAFTSDHHFAQAGFTCLPARQ